MPSQSANVKNEKQYEALKDKGMSKERAARIANSPDASKHGGEQLHELPVRAPNAAPGDGAVPVDLVAVELQRLLLAGGTRGEAAGERLGGESQGVLPVAGVAVVVEAERQLAAAREPGVARVAVAEGDTCRRVGDRACLLQRQLLDEDRHDRLGRGRSGNRRHGGRERQGEQEAAHETNANQQS